MSSTRAETTMLSSPLVTIITPTYNQQEYLHEAIESVLAQTYSNWELILIDDGSTDETVSIIRSYMERDERIQLIRTRNHGSGDDIRLIPTRFCRGEFVTFLDSDDSLFPDSLEKRVAHLVENPDDIGVAAGYRYGENWEDVSHGEFNVDYFLQGFLIRANWGYMFRRHVFDEVDLKPFGLLGDAIVIYELCKRYPNQVEYLDHFLYNYRFTPHGVSFSERGIQNRIAADIKTLRYFMADSDIYPEKKHAILHYVKLLIQWELVNIKTSFPKKLVKHGILGFYNRSFPFKFYCLRSVVWPLVITQQREASGLAGAYHTAPKVSSPPTQVATPRFGHAPICQPRIRQPITNAFFTSSPAGES